MYYLCGGDWCAVLFQPLVSVTTLSPSCEHYFSIWFVFALKLTLLLLLLYLLAECCIHFSFVFIHMYGEAWWQQKKERTVSLKDKPSILRDVGKNLKTCVFLMKQLVLSVSVPNMIVKNFYVIEENAYQCGRYQIFLTSKYTAYCVQNFHSVWQIITCIVILYIFS